MRILLLTQWFDPEPAFKGLLFAKELQQQGHSVEVLTGFPNYPGGKVYPGYKIRPWKREMVEGIRVLRVGLYPSHDRSALGRVLNYVSFAASAAVWGTLLAKKADVVYVYHPPPTVGLAAVCLKYLRGMPFVYDIQDLWPDTLTSTGMITNRGVLKVVGWWCRRLYAAANQIVVLSPGFKKRLHERGVPQEKVTVIYNWAMPIPAAARDRALEERMAGKVMVLFAGNIGAAQGLDVVLDAAKLLQERHPEVCFAFAGSGVEEARLRRRVKEEDIAAVVFLGRYPPEAMGALFARADALLVNLRDDPLFRITIPSKTQAYLAAGKPILMGVEGDAAALAKEAKAGLCFRPGQASELAAVVGQFLGLPQAERQRLGEAGRSFYEEQLSLREGVGKFLQVFSAACQH